VNKLKNGSIRNSYARNIKIIDRTLYVLPKTKNKGKTIYYQIKNQYYDNWFSLLELIQLNECNISLIALKSRLNKLRECNGNFFHLWEPVTKPKVKNDLKNKNKNKSIDEKERKRKLNFDNFLFIMKIMPVGSLSHTVR